MLFVTTANCHARFAIFSFWVRRSRTHPNLAVARGLRLDAIRLRIFVRVTVLKCLDFMRDREKMPSFFDLNAILLNSSPNELNNQKEENK